MSLYDTFNSFKHLPQIIKLILVVIMLSWSSSLASDQVFQPHCAATCGNVSIPYPFGIGDDCHLNTEPWKFFIHCTYDKSSGSVRALLGKDGTVPVTSISLEEGELSIHSTVSSDCYNSSGDRKSIRWIANWGQFPISYTRNKLFAVGCDTQGQITSGSTTTGCTSKCHKDSFNTNDWSCSGVGCCQTSIPKYRKKYIITASSFAKHAEVIDFNRCSYTFVAEENYFNFSYPDDLLNLRNVIQVPTILDWTIGEQTCEEAKNSSSSICAEYSQCIDSANGPGYRCNCTSGYQGNPYLHGGCKDVNECALTPNPCEENICTNRDGSYECSCKDGYNGTANKIGGGGCEKIQLTTKATPPVIAVTVGIVVSLTCFILVVSWLFWGYNTRKHMLLRKKYFEQNGGLMLRQELSKKEGYTETARIFTANELKLATSNYEESRIIGRGGFGTVYKGIQDNDPEKMIAIKKSKVMDQDQIEQFINEVVVLSQINHRNVVRLLGCCLETEVPLLVYEYIDNGTLYEHLHENKDPSGVISWENRLRIAAEIAGVLAYLHSDASIPIVHRDIKSTNILLDHSYIAKVSDFGASRLVPLDQDQLSTMVQGTMGYLDPEYLQTSQLTEKSDVYSFGVVLAELITGKKALAFDRLEEERCLAMYFILSMNNDKLFSVIEDGLVKDGNEKQIEEVAHLALACLRVSGEERPSMREVASELQGLLILEKHPWVDGNIISETQHLLGHQHFSISDTADCNTSVTYGFITRHGAVEDGR